MKYSFLIVNYKTKDDVLILIEDIRRTVTMMDYEIIIVDNASGDVFPRNLPKVKVFYSPENSGFGKGMNLAARNSQGQYLVLVNPDCRIPQNQDFDRFVEESRNKNFGVLAPLIVYPDNSIQPNRGGASNFLTFVFQGLRLGRLKKLIPVGVGKLPLIRNSIIGKYLNNFDAEIPSHAICDWVSGAFMVIPSSLYSSVSGFDENFFMYCEDEDLCLRLSKAGYPSVFSSTFKVIHVVGGSQKNETDKRLNFTEIKRLESNIYFLKKHRSKRAASSLRAFYVILYSMMSFKVRNCASYIKVARKFLKSNV